MAEVARLHRAGRKVDAVRPGLVEGYADETGFPLTARDRLAYNRTIADIARSKRPEPGVWRRPC
ncbi:endo alpha-1,4 polygalactosaminidase [Streptomyces blattellae]|uniref:endo alpha-1,4 polygalactosaminidase n=1 Tax=Streptomyces blattellae TaxID=2569855 RepID=UPI0038B5E874